jgi:hypothetical protein
LAYEELHFGYFLVDFLHELNDEVDQLVLQHFLGVEIGDQKGDVISLHCCKGRTRTRWGTNLDRLSAEDEEGLGSLGQESGEFVDQDVLNLIRLLDLYADADAVDARFDEDPFVVVSRNGQGVEEGLGGCCGLDLRDVVSLRHLGSEVGERQGGSQRRPDALEVGPQGLGLHEHMSTTSRAAYRGMVPWLKQAKCKLQNEREQSVARRWDVGVPNTRTRQRVWFVWLFRGVIVVWCGLL